jgi:hypothetical protein
MSCAPKEFQTGFTLERLEAVEIAIASGELRVKYQDREVEYRSIDELLKVRSLMREKLGLKNNCGEKGIFGGRAITAIHSKGLDKK